MAGIETGTAEGAEALTAPAVAAFTELVDLASERVGGRALAANDEFFAGRENLLRPGRGEFVADRFTDRGKWMDGWETRRRRTPGHDWCIVQLGLPGRIHGVDVDTNHFIGNFPESCTVDAGALDGVASAAELESGAAWQPLTDRVVLRGGSRNLIAIEDRRRWTHVRLNIHPDGGVARFRVHGESVPDWRRVLAAGEPVDLASVVNGGAVVSCSDSFFGLPHAMLFPDRAPHMGDGWETRRRRGPGHDWCVIRLGAAAPVTRVIVDTHHFKGNFPDTCSVEGTRSDGDPGTDAAWRPLVPQSALGADTVHAFGVSDPEPVTHVRLNIFPDGGVSRFRILGLPPVSPDA
jgi:allantoicase